jgi:DtxR family Mn-dependent transcriptional regulator
MENLSIAEENYLKAIFRISEKEDKAVQNKALSQEMDTSAASVTDMMKRLAKKALINLESHKGVTLTPDGVKVATQLVRKHRLWEVFLVEKLQFAWDEVHSIAEEMEHVSSEKLISRLDEFLGYPKFDPHGDPIPDADGNFTHRNQVLLSELPVGASGIIVGVQEHTPSFLQYLDRLGLTLGAYVEVSEIFEFDKSLRILLKQDKEINISDKVSQNLYVRKN